MLTAGSDQDLGQSVSRAAVALTLALTAAALSGVAACSRHQGPAPSQSGRRTPSGLPVPRYVSLKFGTVTARAGPGEDYKSDWVFRAKGLPLQVVAETEDWRRVCGPDGALSWVHKRTVAERRTVMRTAASDLVLRRSATDASAASATLVGHALADLKLCQDGWCKISAGHATGWVRADAVWGVADEVQCRSN